MKSMLALALAIAASMPLAAAAPLQTDESQQVRTHENGTIAANITTQDVRTTKVAAAPDFAIIPGPNSKIPIEVIEAALNTTMMNVEQDSSIVNKHSKEWKARCAISAIFVWFMIPYECSRPDKDD